MACTVDEDKLTKEEKEAIEREEQLHSEMIKRQLEEFPVKDPF
ncbi:hypothetical protein [Pediococcus stilesii]|nr:hypothetical protein [Pediococcus stilesii]